jgi:hypothetical protein
MHTTIVIIGRQRLFVFIETPLAPRRPQHQFQDKGEALLPDPRRRWDLVVVKAVIVAGLESA